jgi:hypothetical protein
MKKQDLINFCVLRNACDEAMDWLVVQPGTAKQIYERCDNPNWLQWFYDKLDVGDNYRAKHQPLLDDYRAKRKPIWDDYEAKRQTLWDDYRAKRQTLKIKWQVIRDLIVN